MRRFAILLLLVSLPALAQDNGYQKKPARDRNTSEPAATWVKGAFFYGDDVAIPGEVTQDQINDSFSCMSDCLRFCQLEIRNPYCYQLGTWCEGTSGGGASCHCIFFCESHGGHQFHPHELVVISDGSGVGPCL